MKTLGYLGIDQHGRYYVIKKHPRKELIKQVGVSHVRKMYCNMKDGSVKEKGYVISGLWISIFRVCPWKKVEEERKRQVVIEVLGGVATVSECPDDVEVEIRDHDDS
jgi:hypothetical protein